jgi:hypothetical protein
MVDAGFAQTSGQMRTKPFAYFLILLITLAQVDDVWIVVPVSPLAALADDNDEYLPSRRPPLQGRSSSHRKPAFAGQQLSTGCFSFVPKLLPSGQSLPATFAPHSLYVFMSLQI